jgi:hypothetical protein
MRPYWAEENKALMVSRSCFLLHKANPLPDADTQSKKHINQSFLGLT